MKSLNIYKEKFKKYGNSPQSLLWKNRGAAHQRFRQFWAEIDFSNKSVLDIGCGFGELGKFLIKRYPGVKYTGIDNVSEFIEIAKKEVLEGKFFVADYLADLNFAGPATRQPQIHPQGDPGFGAPRLVSPATFDIVIASGVLNSNMGGQSENFDYRKKAIAKMFSLTSNVLAFNMSGGHPVQENMRGSNIYYSDSLEILDYCMTRTRRVILRHHYNPKDFTIFMYHVKK